MSVILALVVLLLQEDEDGIDHPWLLLKEVEQTQKRLSTVEKETLALILALQHFQVYVPFRQFPVEVFTDQNPFTFLTPWTRPW